MKRKILGGLLALCLLLSAMASGAPPMQANETTNTEAVHNHETGWTELTIGNGGIRTLLNGKYFVKEDSSLAKDTTITVKGNVILCLNGHKMDAQGHKLQFNVQKSAVLTICDCSNAIRQGYIGEDGLWHEGAASKETDVVYPLQGGVITGHKSNLQLIVSVGTVQFESGNIAGNVISLDSGSLIAARTGGNINLSGGNIIGNVAQALSIEANSSGKMDNGVIAHHTAKKAGAAVAVSGDGASFEMNGGTISDNTATAQGGGLYLDEKAAFKLSGNAIIKNNQGLNGHNNIYLKNNIITMSNTLQSESSIGVSVANPDQAVLTSGWNTHMQNQEPSAYFYSENPDYVILKNESGEAAFVKRTAYSIQYKDVGGGDFSGMLPEGAASEHIYGIATTLPTPTKEGFVFEGWYLDATESGPAITALAAETDQEVTVYAKWRKEVQAPIITQQPQDVTLDVGTEGALSIIATAEEGDVLCYQWYQTDSETDASSGTPITGAIHSTFGVGKDVQPGIYHYYCVVTATQGQESKHTTSAVATVTVNKPALQAPTITMQPQDIVFEDGVGGTLSVEATSPTGDALSYQWYQTGSKTDTSNGTPITDATHSTLSIGREAQSGIYHYYCVVTATRGQECKHTTSAVATVTIAAPVVPPSRPTPILPGETVTNPDGSVTTTVIKQDGTTVATTQYPNGEALTLTTAPSGLVKVTLDGAKARLVTLPGKGFGPETVALVIDAKGQRHIETHAVATQQGMVLEVHDGDLIELVQTNVAFVDVKNDYWAKESVIFAAARGLLVGVDERHFAPEMATSRAMIWSILARVDGAELEASDPWYRKNQEWAVGHGVSDGTNPNGSITREQLASMLYRYADTPRVHGTLEGFEDAENVSDWALDGVTWAVQEGLLTGANQGTLAPQKICSRAQTAAMLERFIVWQLGV